MKDSILLKIDSIQDYETRVTCLSLLSKGQLFQVLQLQLMDSKRVIKCPYRFNEHFSRLEILNMVKDRKIPAEVYLR